MDLFEDLTSIVGPLAMPYEPFGALLDESSFFSLNPSEANEANEANERSPSPPSVSRPVEASPVTSWVDCDASST